MSWDDAVEFCNRLSAYTGRDYRLPSEAEWEYACRAKTVTPFHFGQTITPELANYFSSVAYRNAPTAESPGRTTPIGQYPPNTFGLYDMHGTVWEWCLDHWHGNYEGAPTDGTAWLDKDKSQEEGATHVLRGGSWAFNPRNCRSAYRNFSRSDILYDNLSRDVGFRVVCAAPGTP